MMKLLCAVSVFVLTGLNLAYAATQWTYASPNDWATNFPSFCAGTKQSPVDLDSKVAQNGNQPTPTLAGQGVLTSGATWTMTADGHSVKVPVSGAGLTFTMDLDPQEAGNYILDSFHLHWGRTASEGSEHAIDGKKYALEVHFVHYNSKYTSVATALADPKGLAVLGIMFQEVESVSSGNLISRLLPADMSPLRTVAGQTNLAAFNIVDQIMREADPKRFYRYTGSLTTPSCNEVVTWTVLRDPLMVSTAQMNSIRQVALNNGDTFNYRPVQPLNARTLYRNTSSRERMSLVSVLGLISLITFLSL